MRLFKRKSRPAEVKQYTITMPLSQFKWDQILGISGYKENEFYSKVWNIYRAVSMVARRLSTLPFQLMERSFVVGKEDREITDYPHLNLLRGMPNNFQTGIDFMESMASYIQLSGNAYCRILGDKKRPTEFLILPSARVVPVPGDTANPVKHYKYTPKDAEMIIPVEEMAHAYYFNPDNMICGLSPLTVANTIAETQQLSEKWNQHLLRNNARPSNLISIKGALSPGQRSTLEKDIKDNWEGPGNAGKMHILEGGEGVKVEKISFSPQDLDWINSMKMTMRQIVQIFGVDSTLLGDFENKTYSNMKEARKGLYEETIIPLAEKLFRTFEYFFFYNPVKQATTHYFKIKKEDIEILQTSLPDMINALEKAWYLTPNQKLAILNKELSDDPAMDERYIPSNLIPFDMIGGPPLEL